MSNPQQNPSPSQPPFASQRDLVGLALHRGARRPAAQPVANAQRDRVRLALALGVGSRSVRGRRR
jgi:hypothetical protein